MTARSTAEGTSGRARVHRALPQRWRAVFEVLLLDDEEVLERLASCSDEALTDYDARRR